MCISYQGQRYGKKSDCCMVGDNLTLLLDIECTGTSSPSIWWIRKCVPPYSGRNWTNWAIEMVWWKSLFQKDYIRTPTCLPYIWWYGWGACPVSIWSLQIVAAVSLFVLPAQAPAMLAIFTAGLSSDRKTFATRGQTVEKNYNRFCRGDVNRRECSRGAMRHYGVPL